MTVGTQNGMSGSIQRESFIVWRRLGVTRMLVPFSLPSLVIRFSFTQLAAGCQVWLSYWMVAITQKCRVTLMVCSLLFLLFSTTLVSDLPIPAHGNPLVFRTFMDAVGIACQRRSEGMSIRRRSGHSARRMALRTRIGSVRSPTVEVGTSDSHCRGATAR